MLTVVKQKSWTMAIDVHFRFDMSFATEKRISVSALFIKINKQLL
jgi:hypothetical protein